jgi:hypothetical protein
MPENVQKLIEGDLQGRRNGERAGPLPGASRFYEDLGDRF